jgi:hypothetical protein
LVERPPHQEPRNELEEKVASLWREVLQLEEVGIHDNFFAVGGHSVHMVRLGNRLSAELGKEFPLVAMFEHPTISSFAHFLSEDGVDNPVLERGMHRGERRHELELKRRAWLRKP